MVKNKLARVNIGALSRATEIPTETLRTWERRYNFPAPDRLPSGHRRYDASLIPHLRAIKFAIDKGYRPSSVLQIPLAELLTLIGQTPKEEASRRSRRPQEREQTNWLEKSLQAMRTLDSNALRSILETRTSRHGFQRFAMEDCPRLIGEIGERWRAGELTIANEHFASFVVQDMLSREWMRLSALNSGKTCIMATPSGEDHVLGLHLAAYVVAVNGHRLVWLDANCPKEAVAEVARSSSASHALLSFSESYPKDEAMEYAEGLHQIIPATTQLVFGGKGCPIKIPGTLSFRSLQDLSSYMNQLA